MIFCPNWNTFSLAPPPIGSVLAWTGAPLASELADILEDLESQACEQRYTLVWDDIADLATAYEATADFEARLRSAVDRVFVQEPHEREIDIVCFHDQGSWELTISFSVCGVLGGSEVHEILTRRLLPRSPQRVPAATLDDADRERFSQIQKVVRARVLELWAKRAAQIEKAKTEKWPPQRLAAELGDGKIDTYAVAAGLKLSGDYLTAWLRKRGLANAHALIRREKLTLAERLIADGNAVRVVALQLGFSDVDYFKRLLAERSSDASGEARSKT